MKQSNKAAQYGLLVALALILSYAEAQIPAFFALPGMKLGLTNLVVLTALYLMDEKSALCINLVRILLVSLLFGNGMSLAFSLSGGLLSGGVMLLLKRTERLRIVAVSAAGGVAHNVGQVLAAMLLMNTASLAWYFVVLWFSGIASGVVIGVIGGMLCERLRSIRRYV